MHYAFYMVKNYKVMQQMCDQKYKKTKEKIDLILKFPVRRCGNKPSPLDQHHLIWSHTAVKEPACNALNTHESNNCSHVRHCLDKGV